MAHVSDLIATDIDAATSRRTSRRPAALHHLRQRRRRQEHADRPAAVRLEDAVRGPARRASKPTRASGARRATTSTSRCWSTAWRPSASRASRSTSPTASSRPSGASSSSPTRRATSSTRATWSPARRPPTPRSPGRRAQGRADADAPPQLPRVAARHPPRRASPINKMDLVDYSEKTFRRASSRTTARSPSRSASRTSPFIPVSAFKGDNITAPSEKMPWYRGPTLMGYLETVEVDEERMQRGAVPPAGAVGQPPRPRLPRLLRHDRRRHGAHRATASACSPRARRAPSRASSRSTATCRRPWRASPSR